jgi:parvulin-like peptidyl-prolyl isomerase
MLFNQYTVEILCMRRLKSEMWKVDIAIVGMLLLLVLIVWVPVSAAGAYEGVSGLASPVIGTMQATPTEDATVTELNKEKLQQEVKQLQEQNDAQVIASNKEKLQHENDWWWNYGATILSSFISTLILVSGALIGFWQ